MSSAFQPANDWPSKIRSNASSARGAPAVFGEAADAGSPVDFDGVDSGADMATGPAQQHSSRQIGKNRDIII